MEPIKSNMKKIIYALPALFLLLSSCIEQIRFDVPREGGQIIVDGRFTDEFSQQEIKLGFSATNTSIPTPIRDATITLFDDQGNQIGYTEDPKRPGTFVMDLPGMEAIAGRSYFIEVNLPSGETYRSVPEVFTPNPAQLSNIRYEFSTRERTNEAAIVFEAPFIDVYVDTDLSAADDKPFYLRWDVEEVYKLTPTDFPDPFGNIPIPCYVYVYTSAQNPILFDGSNTDATSIDNLLVGSQEIGIEFLEKHFFSVYQRSLSREAFEYWEKVASLVTNVGSIFDAPPAPIPGNIYNVNDPEEEALGYFEVAGTTVLRFSTIRQDIPQRLIPQCEYSPSITEYPVECLNCLRKRNSTIVRPPFFD